MFVTEVFFENENRGPMAGVYSTADKALAYFRSAFSSDATLAECTFCMRYVVVGAKRIGRITRFALDENRPAHFVDD
jgi:hypothetical protein